MKDPRKNAALRGKLTKSRKLKDEMAPETGPVSLADWFKKVLQEGALEMESLRQETSATEEPGHSKG